MHPGLSRRALLTLAAAALATPARRARAAEALPFDIRVYGHFERMMRDAAFAGRVRLADAVSAPGVYAVGALAGLEGEVTAHGGRLFVSYGRRAGARIVPAPPDAEAALLVTARVERWVEEPIEVDLAAMPDIEAAVAAAAARRGIDASRPFPFLVRGTITGYAWHVLAGPGEPPGGEHGGRGGHGRRGGHAAADRVVRRGDRMAADLVGFYSGPALEGVITHPGERIHVHLLDPGRTVTGHLDAFGLAAGAVLSLPAA
ncbi:MAG TPA: hypothetical protein VIM86_00860 [Thermodesulfobacteriota bacterium]